MYMKKEIWLHGRCPLVGLGWVTFFMLQVGFSICGFTQVGLGLLEISMGLFWAAFVHICATFGQPVLNAEFAMDFGKIKFGRYLRNTQCAFGPHMGHY